MTVAVLPVLLACSACVVAFLTDLLATPADRALMERLEAIETPLVIAAVSAFGPGLFKAGEEALLLCCLGGAWALGRHTAGIVQCWRREKLQR